MKFTAYPYERPDLNQYKQAFYNNILKLKNATNSNEALQAIESVQNLQNEIGTQAELSFIRYSIDTNDSFYIEESAFWDENRPIISEWESEFYQLILQSPFLDELKEMIPAPYFKLIENSIKVFSPTIIPLLQTENKLVTQYESLIASANIEYKGDHYNLSGLLPFMQSTDRQERKQTNELYTQFFQDNIKEFDTIYDELVKVRHQMALELGFDNFVEMGYARMNRLDYDQEDVATFRQEVIQHFVPLANYIFERQGQRLSLESLKYYDLSLEFASGNAKPIGSSEEIINKAKTMYHEMSEETGEFFDFMLDHDLLDLLTKKGKQSGGYCTYIPNFESPFIFANFNGTSADVDVLTHEAGHAFQVYQSRHISEPELIWPTTESCEIHSMSMEFIAWPWMDAFFGDQVDKYKYSHLASAATFLPYGVLVDHFQHEIYSHPEMAPSERRSKWRELERMYNPWKDFEDNHFYANGGLWMRQGHIYSSPFYYIDYALAQVCAIQFWQRSQINHDDSYWSDYMAICRAGGTLSFKEIVEVANLKSPFEQGNLQEVSQSIKEYLENITEEQLN